MLDSGSGRSHLGSNPWVLKLSINVSAQFPWLPILVFCSALCELITWTATTGTGKTAEDSVSLSSQGLPLAWDPIWPPPLASSVESRAASPALDLAGPGLSFLMLSSSKQICLGVTLAPLLPHSDPTPGTVVFWHFLEGGNLPYARFVISQTVMSPNSASKVCFHLQELEQEGFSYSITLTRLVLNMFV